VRVSRDIDKKSVFSLSGRGHKTRIIFNSPSGKAGDTALEITDKACSVCPTGAILPKHLGYETPVGERLYDRLPISVVGDAAEHHTAEKPFINGDSDE
jgi:[NiFe] hydrogenase diaphorase moiety small subunit